jgi:hypothetical protein
MRRISKYFSLPSQFLLHTLTSTQKTFIVATLCSTLIGTFTASMGLYDRVAEKREKRKQGHRDTKQDSEIKKLQDQVSAAEKQGQERGQRIQELQGGRGRDDVGNNLGMSGAMIQRQYDEGYGRMGRKFAQGDSAYTPSRSPQIGDYMLTWYSPALTENQLQAQIIALQQTVIHVLQDALYNDRPLTRADQAKIIAASNSAREGSLNALREQQLRLNANLRNENERPSPPRSIAAPKRASTVIEAGPSLYCRYSLDLQYIQNKPLAANFAPGEDCHCPACGLRVDATSDDFWAIGKRTPLLVSSSDGYEKEVMETREFHLGQRFVIKCHTADGEYACVLCTKNRDTDAICRSVDALVNHVGNFHDVEELEREVDLRERDIPLPREREMPLPRKTLSIVGAPPAVPSPPVVREYETVKQYVYQ